MRALLLCLLFFVFIPLKAEPAKVDLSPCFEMSKIENISRQIETILKNEFCRQKLNPKKYVVIVNQALPRLMNKSFLGVEPPANWQLLTTTIIENCLGKKDLCLDKHRTELNQCLINQFPLFLVQFAPWISENCTVLNKELIKGWPEKKEIFIQIMKDTHASEL